MKFPIKKVDVNKGRINKLVLSPVNHNFQIDGADEHFLLQNREKVNSFCCLCNIINPISASYRLIYDSINEKPVPVFFQKSL